MSDKRKFIINVIIIALLVTLLVFQVAAAVIVVAYIKTGRALTVLMDDQKLDKAIRLAETYSMPGSDDIKDRLLSGIEAQEKQFAAGSESYDDAAKSIEKYDKLAEILGYSYRTDMSGMQFLDKLHSAGKSMDRAHELVSTNINVGSNAGNAINRYDSIEREISDCRNYFPDFDEKRDADFTTFVNNLNSMLKASKRTKVREYIADFKKTCSNRDCNIMLDDIIEEMDRVDLSNEIGEINEKVEKYKKDGNYPLLLATIEKAMKSYPDDIAFVRSLQAEKDDCIPKLLDQRLDSHSYRLAVDMADEYGSEYSDIDFYGKISASMKKYVADSAKSHAFVTAYSQIRITKASDNDFGLRKIGIDQLETDLLEAWYSYKRDEHIYFDGDRDTDPSAYDLAVMLGKDTSFVISDALNYQRSAIIDSANKIRKSSGLSAFTEYTQIDNAAQLCANRISGGGDSEKFNEIIRGCGLGSMYESGAGYSWSSLWYKRAIRDIVYEITENMPDDEKQDYFGDPAFRKIGIGAAFDSATRGFYWYILLFS